MLSKKEIEIMINDLIEIYSEDGFKNLLKSFGIKKIDKIKRKSKNLIILNSIYRRELVNYNNDLMKQFACEPEKFWHIEKFIPTPHSVYPKKIHDHYAID